jgi:uncharacterized GH25 family protein
MKKSILTFAILLFVSVQSFAHYLWIEANPKGEKDKKQEVRVYFGEYTFGVIEKVDGEAFPKVKDFTVWLVDAKGVKSRLLVSAKEDHYVGYFTPKVDGIYTVVLNNNTIEVIDYTQYDFGIFKTHYNSIAKVTIGNAIGETVAGNPAGITVKDVSKNNEEVILQVLYKNKPLPKNDFKVYMADLWTKTLETDENGYVSFKKPWNTKYIIETTFEERVPGIYKGEAYDFIWHCATSCIQ